MSSRDDGAVDVRRRFGGGPVTGALSVVVVVAVVVVLLFLVRDAAYRATASGAVALPSVVGGLLEVIGELGLVVLAGVAVLLTWRARSQGLEHLAVAAVAAVSTVAAYVLSEVVKGFVREERPCRTLSVHTVAACPASGDWSWPSNHATIAGSLATAIVVLAPVWWRLAVPLALAVGASRVLTGAHYWHDVVAGLAVGVLVVWFGTWALAPTAHRLLQRSVASGSPRWRRAVGQGYEPRYAATDLPDEGADGETADPS
ncbi:phosphatase PAP2 family protein [Terrabacter sp. C0L_2]|uniref:phosphatase PAP2 family protein n=1 Tax=Terrabacter sp. C0L_2 TaxID=3108389 RepID=UPI002ED18AA2|nr:phosphatase PAP2 family protein [Terrabacter sp. C0L_2]